MRRTVKITISMLTLTAALPLAAQQQASSSPSEESLLSNVVFNVMLSFIVLLLLVIIAMAEVVKAGAAQRRAQVKKEKQNLSGPAGGLLLLFLLSAASLHAQDAAITDNGAAVSSIPFNYWGMGAAVFYVMMSIIFFEMLIAVMLFRSGMMLIRPDVKKAAAEKAEPSLLEKLNASVAVEEEHAIMMDHDYDGIRELDNNLPPWWKYGFYLTIVVAVVYLLNFHVFHTGKLPLDEYSQEMKEGEAAIAEYRKDAVDLIDENTVTLLTDAASLNEGKAIFEKNCVACHGEFGEGKDGLGPNFTDDYWLHGGSVSSVFRSVKYGWPAKFMKSWKQDLKPSEIQQVVSYVKSLRGTNPPNPKAKQGELYIEEGAKPLADSTKTGDSLMQPETDQGKK